jgi:hypothetical protein
MHCRSFNYVFFLLLIMSLTGIQLQQCGKQEPKIMTQQQTRSEMVVKEMIAKFGKENASRIKIGVNQVSKFWTDADGNQEAFKEFCLNNFIADKDQLRHAFKRLETATEALNGLIVENERLFQWNLQVDTGPVLPIDYLLANFSLGSHVEEDLYKTKIAFFVVLNFEQYSLADALKYGKNWSRQKWAEVRLAQQFTSRVPADLAQKKYETYVAADDYISNYNIYMNNLLDENRQRLFPEGLKLISHWGLRDELKAQYNQPDGLPRQKLIYEVMQRIIFQEIPRVVINNPEVNWQVTTNTVMGKNVDNSREPDTRYQELAAIFQAERAVDPYYPLYPTKIARCFDRDREIPETTVEQLFVQLLTSNEFKNTGELVRQRLGRELEPFDIWYSGFKPVSQYSEGDLDKIVAAKYPTVEAFQSDIPNILTKLGFELETAEYLATKIEIDPSRGAGHAMSAGRRTDNSHLRTRVPEGGMNYKGFNIAMHELGHCVEQVFSLNKIDHTLLQGVPNTAFTEAFAFVFQKRDLDVLGMTNKDTKAEYLDALRQIWDTAEIAGVALVDMRVWHWLYDHPAASIGELKEAVIQIARDVWNAYFFPVLGHRDAPILAIYSHMIDSGLYLPDYPIGHIIQFQIEEYIKGKNLGKEMQRMCVQGSITPNLWMELAVKNEISIAPLLKVAGKALKAIS